MSHSWFKISSLTPNLKHKASSDTIYLPSIVGTALRPHITHCLSLVFGEGHVLLRKASQQEVLYEICRDIHVSHSQGIGPLLQTSYQVHTCKSQPAEG